MSSLANHRKDFLILARLSNGKMFADILNDSSPRRLTSLDRHA